MQLGANQRGFSLKAALLLAVIILIITFFVFQYSGQTQIAQNISYGDFELSKTINLNSVQNQRVEEYSFDLKNPVVVYLIVPKSIATSVSQVKISGDFTSEVIKSDPIIKLTPKDTSPGIKKFVISTQINDSNKTTLAFVIPLIEYSKATTEEKANYEMAILEADERGEENFTIEESKKIMQGYANGLKTILVSAQENTVKASFAAPSQNPSTKIPSGSPFLSKAAQVIREKVPQRDTNAISLNDGYSFTIDFKGEDETNELPKDINFYVSKEISSDEGVYFFKTESEDLTQSPEVITEGELSEYIKGSIIQGEEVSVLTVSVKVPKEKFADYPNGTIIENQLIIKKFLTAKTIPVKVTFGECEQKAGDVQRQIPLDAETKSFIITTCYAEKIQGINEELKQDLNTLFILRDAIITHSASVQGSVPFYTNEMENSFNYGNPYNMSFNQISSNYTILSSDFAKMKSMELLTNDELIYGASCRDANTILKDTNLVPQSLYDSNKSKTGYGLTDYSNLLKKDLNISKDYYAYFDKFCEYREKLFKAQELENDGKSSIRKFVVENSSKDNNDLIDAQTELFEQAAISQILKEKLQKFVLSNKILQAESLYELEHDKYSLIGTQGIVRTLPSIPEKGWVFESSESVIKDINKKNNELDLRQGEVLANYLSASKFFNCESEKCAFYKKYFELMRNFLEKEYFDEKYPGYWPSELDLVNAQDLLYSHLKNTSSNERSGMLTSYLVNHFRAELENDLSLLETLNGSTGTTIESLEPSWSTWFRPVKIGEVVGQSLFNIEDDQINDLYEYRTRLIAEINNLKLLKAFVNREWGALLDKNEPIQGIVFFSDLKKRFENQVSGTTSYSSLINTALFEKFLALEKELQSLKTSSDLNSFKINFMKKEMDNTFEIGLQYQTNSIYPMARIYYAEIIETEINSKSNPYYYKEIVDKAKNNTETIKLKLTWFEKKTEGISDWIYGKRSATELNLKYSTADYRSGVTIWRDRIDLFTDLRYIIAFEVTGAGALVGSVFKTMGSGVKVGVGKILATKGGKALMSSALTKKIGSTILTSYTRSSNFLPFQLSQIRALETRWLLQMENRSLARLLGSKPGEYLVGRNVWNGGIFGTQKWVNARANLIPRGNYKVLFDERVGFLAYQLAKKQALEAPDDILLKPTFAQYAGRDGGQLSVGIGTTDTSQKFVVVYLVTPDKSTPGSFIKKSVVLLDEGIAKAGATPANGEVFQALALLSSGNTSESTALTQVVKNFGAPVNAITTRESAQTALVTAGVYFTRAGVVSTVSRSLPQAAVANQVLLATSSSVGVSSGHSIVNIEDSYYEFSKLGITEIPYFNSGKYTIMSPTQGYLVEFFALSKDSAQLVADLSEHYSASPMLQALYPSREEYLKLYLPEVVGLEEVEFRDMDFDALPSIAHHETGIGGGIKLPTFAGTFNLKEVATKLGVVLPTPYESATMSYKLFVTEEARKQILKGVLDSVAAHEATHAACNKLPAQARITLGKIYSQEGLDPQIAEFFGKISEAYGHGRNTVMTAEEMLAYKVEEIERALYLSNSPRISSLGTGTGFTTLDVEVLRSAGLISEEIATQALTQARSVTIDDATRTLLNELSAARAEVVPTINLAEATTVSKSMCAKGCSVTTTATALTAKSEITAAGNLAEQTASTARLDFGRVKSVSIRSTGFERVGDEIELLVNAIKHFAIEPEISFVLFGTKPAFLGLNGSTKLSLRELEELKRYGFEYFTTDAGNLYFYDPIQVEAIINSDKPFYSQFGNNTRDIINALDSQPNMPVGEILGYPSRSVSENSNFGFKVLADGKQVVGFRADTFESGKAVASKYGEAVTGINPRTKVKIFYSESVKDLTGQNVWGPLQQTFFNNPVASTFSCHSPCVFDNGKSFEQGNKLEGDFAEISSVRRHSLPEGFNSSERELLRNININGFSMRDASGAIVNADPQGLIAVAMQLQAGDPPLWVLRTENGTNVIDVYTIAKASTGGSSLT